MNEAPTPLPCGFEEPEITVVDRSEQTAGSRLGLFDSVPAQRTSGRLTAAELAAVRSLFPQGAGT